MSGPTPLSGSENHRGFLVRANKSSAIERSHDEQFLSAMRREKIRADSRTMNSEHSQQERDDAFWLVVAVQGQIVAIETRIAQAAERAALLAELDAVNKEMIDAVDKFFTDGEQRG